MKALGWCGRFSEKLTKYTYLLKRETIINQTVLRIGALGSKQLPIFATSRQTHPPDMEKRVHSRARSNFISFVVLLAAIYVILVTGFIATLYRFTVMQADKIQTLEAIADDLAARVYKLESRFKAQGTQESYQGGSDGERQERTEKRLTNKVTNACNVISGVCCQNFA